MRIRDDRYGGRPITWQQFVIVLSVIGLFAAYVILVDDSLSRTTRSVGWWILAVSIINIAGATGSFFLSSTRRDRAPDIVAHISPHKEILQAGDAHYTLDLHQAGNRLRIAVVVQNLRSGKGMFQLGLSGIIGPRFRLPPQFPVKLQVRPAEVLACLIELPFEPIARSTGFFARISVACKTSGRRVRYKRHRILGRPLSRMIVYLGILGGHVLHSEAAAVELSLDPCSDSANSENSRIICQTLWELGDECNWNEIKANADQLLRLNPAEVPVHG